MSEWDYDLVVVGGGSGGHAAASEAAKLGLKTALVERAKTLGGLCILRGCMPSKTLIETANRMRKIRESAPFGIETTPPELNHAVLLARLEKLISGFQSHRAHSMQSANYDLLRGDAYFTSQHELEIDGKTKLRSQAFVIATGSTTSIPKIPGLKETPYWTSDDIARLPRLPSHIVIIGSGSVGVESAHFFEGLGSRVTILCRSKRILGSFDRDSAEALNKASEARGITIHTETEATSVRHSDGRFKLVLDGPSCPTEIVAEELLVATGRDPDTKSLGLERAGVITDSGSIQIDPQCETSQPHIFAVGDCASSVPVVHLAVIQGQIAGRNAAKFLGSKVGTLKTTWESKQTMVALFSCPELAQLGLSVRAAIEAGIDAEEKTYRFSEQGKGMIVGDQFGFVKIVAEKGTGRIIGAAAVGPDVVDSIHIMQLAIEARMTVKGLLETPFYHPTLAEIWTYCAEEFESA